MVTLNSIVDNIAFDLGDLYNDTLRESIKNKVINFRELFIRQDLQRNFLNYNTYIQTICLELEEVDASMCENLPTGMTVLRTKQKVPRPLRLSNNGAVNFKYVGFINSRKAFTFSTAQSLQYKCALPLQSNAIYYDYTNDKITVFGLDHICKIGVQMVVSDPRDIDDCRYPNTFKDDIEFPLSNDMVGQISDIIVKSYRTPVIDGEEVNTEKDD